MSLVIYNGISLPYAYHTHFQQEAVYDESGTNWIATKFDISIQCVLNTNYVTIIDPTVAAGANPATIMATIRRKLLKPRQQLQIIVGGVNLVPNLQAGNKGYVDAMNGPQPQSCQIAELTNTTFLVVWRVTANFWESPLSAGTGTANAVGNNVLSNRWSESVSINQRKYSTRVRQGIMMIRSDNAGAKIADEVRQQMAVVGIPQGFFRTGAEYVVDPNGLAIRYTITDEEKWLMPPKPAYQAEGHYIESAGVPGQPRMATVRVLLRGAKDSKQSDLITEAVAVGMSKVNAEKGNALKIAWLNNISLRLELYDNEVEFTASWVMNAKRSRFGKGAIKLAAQDNVPYARGTQPPLDSEPGKPPPAWTLRGTAGLLLQAAAYYDPSVAATKIVEQQGQLSPGKEVGRVGVLDNDT